MWQSLTEKAVRYTKQIQDIGLFATMTNSRWFIAFGGSPLYYVMLPFIGILMTILAVFNGYKLTKADNQNFDKWLSFAVDVISALGASFSLYGAAIATYLGVSFVAGPWVFFSCLLLATTQQAIMLAINLKRAFDSPVQSAQRMHHIQAAINNTYIIALVLAALGAVFFVMLFPIASTLGSVCATTVVALNVADLLWNITPRNWRLLLKNYLSLGKPALDITKSAAVQEKPREHPAVIPIAALHQNHFFRKSDYSAQMHLGSYEENKSFLLSVISKKLELLANSSQKEREKNTQKSAFLKSVSTDLTNNRNFSKQNLLKQYPLALQSFWAEKGEVEQIMDASLVLLHRYQETTTIDERMSDRAMRQSPS